MRKNIIAIMILCVMLFSGCVNSIDINSKENTLIAEYAAGLLIKNSNFYKDRYYFWDEEDVSQEIPSESESSQDGTEESPSTINPNDKPTSEVEKELAGEGRVLIRPSGTEALIRVMIEGLEQEDINKKAKKIADVIKKRFGI